MAWRNLREAERWGYQAHWKLKALLVEQAALVQEHSTCKMLNAVSLKTGDQALFNEIFNLCLSDPNGLKFIYNKDVTT